jgi:hypothetical protein
MMMAFTGMTIERKTRVRSTKLSASTKVMTMGRYSFIESM